MILLMCALYIKLEVLRTSVRLRQLSVIGVDQGGVGEKLGSRERQKGELRELRSFKNMERFGYWTIEDSKLAMSGKGQ